jgi:hypothetical protein
MSLIANCDGQFQYTIKICAFDTLKGTQAIWLQTRENLSELRGNIVEEMLVRHCIIGGAECGCTWRKPCIAEYAIICTPIKPSEIDWRVKV